MIFPVKRVKEELVKEFAASKLPIKEFAEAHSIKPEALRSWINEKMHPVQKDDSDFDIFQASEFVELDIPEANKHSISIGQNRKDLITVRAGGIEIDIPITTEETTLFKIFQTAASI